MMAQNETVSVPVHGPDTWVPVPARILHIKDENFNTYTIRLAIEDETFRNRYRWSPGQFNMLYAPGVGEAAISISSDPENPSELEHTIRVVGSVTRAIKKIGEGGVIGLRGPFGTSWPTEGIKGKNVVMVAGGIGLAPIRPMVYWLLHHRQTLQAGCASLWLPFARRPGIRPGTGRLGTKQRPGCFGNRGQCNGQLDGPRWCGDAPFRPDPG